jgi:hypothetical protein
MIFCHNFPLYNIEFLPITQYDDGRVTVMTDQELVVEITSVCKELGIVL